MYKRQASLHNKAVFDERFVVEKSGVVESSVVVERSLVVKRSVFTQRSVSADEQKARLCQCVLAQHDPSNLVTHIESDAARSLSSAGNRNEFP